jgi:hypothetical protein
MKRKDEIFSLKGWKHDIGSIVAEEAKRMWCSKIMHGQYD